MQSETIFRLVQGLIFVAFIAHRAYYTRKYPPNETDTLEKQSPTVQVRIANLLAGLALVSLVIYLFVPRWVAWAGLPLPDWLRWFGVLLVLLGFGLLQWSHRALGRNWSDQPRIFQDQEFIASGPYRWIRHPMYTSFLLILGSTLLISANWLVGGLWIVSTALDIHARIRFEEARMLDRFGEAYRAYMQRTGALLPRW